MANYFDNQPKWEWNISEERVLVMTDHGDHTHTLDVTNVPIGEMADHTGKVMGDAHRAVPHDYKEAKSVDKNTKNNVEKDGMEKREDFLERIKVDAETQAKLAQAAREFKDRNTSKKEDNGGRERGDEGPASLGRESGLKGGYSKSDSKVAAMRADMKSNTNVNANASQAKGQSNANASHGRGQSNANGHAVSNAGKSNAPTAAAQGNASGNGTSGHGNSAGSTGGGHGGLGGNSGGGHGGLGGNSGGGHGGSGGSSGGGHGGSSGSSGGGHGGSGGSSGGGHGGSGGGHGGH